MPQALSSSSSSNQSYGDASSPSNYQTPLNYQIEEQLGDCFDVLSGWKETYDSSGTIVNSSDTIELLQLVEQMIEEDKQRKTLKEPQIASSAPCFSPATYNGQCVVPVRALHSSQPPSELVAARSNKPAGNCGLAMSNASPMVRSLMDGSLVSVYTTKEGTGGCTFVDRAVNAVGHASIGPEQRFYEPKAPQLDVSQHSSLCDDIAGLNEPPARNPAENQSLRSSQDKYALPHAVDRERKYSQPSAMYAPNDYQIPTVVSSFVPPNRPQR